MATAARIEWEHARIPVPTFVMDDEHVVIDGPIRYRWRQACEGAPSAATACWSSSACSARPPLAVAAA
jgi:hypothetical protein